ncbi:MAG TPA: response regulator [Gemmataceae bacterium]|nr:response regulator [Gemmataceae bacterium]
MLPHERSTNRVLCVDDNHDAAESLALLLRLVGLQAEAAFDGPSALRTAAWFLPHACVSDINMPGMDGFELARRLRAWAESRPLLLIALTARTTEDDRRRSLEAGFDVHLNKPADSEEVVRLVVAFGSRRTVSEEPLEADPPLIVPAR